MFWSIFFGSCVQNASTAVESWSILLISISIGALSTSQLILDRYSINPQSIGSKVLTDSYALIKNCVVTEYIDSPPWRSTEIARVGGSERVKFHKGRGCMQWVKLFFLVGLKYVWQNTYVVSQLIDLTKPTEMLHLLK